MTGYAEMQILGLRYTDIVKWVSGNASQQKKQNDFTPKVFKKMSALSEKNSFTKADLANLFHQNIMI